jgi:uncharacterized coiled-coil protein SlyX
MEEYKMNNYKSNKTMPLGFALLLMLLIALAGGVAFYLENRQKQELLAASEQALIDQQNHLNAVYGQIEANLASIRERESMISRGFSGPEKTDGMLPEDRIQHEIDYIKYLMAENDKLIAGLNDQIGKKDARIAGYERSVKDLQARVTKYQEQLDLLIAEKAVLMDNLDLMTLDRDRMATRLDEMGNEVAQKNSVLEEKNRQLLEQDKALHTAYYRIGPYKTLRDLEILEKEGGFLGINRVTALTDDPDAGLFTEIDTRQVTRIPIVAKRWEIVTTHDRSSYELEYVDNQAEWLNITDPEKFWSKSKYLVIVVRNEGYGDLTASR